MMNYVALHVTNALIRQVAGKDMTERIHETASLRVPYFEQITDYSRLHGGIFIALLAVFIVWFILERTTLGFELKSVVLTGTLPNMRG